MKKKQKKKSATFFTRKSLATVVVGLMLIQGFYLIQLSTATHDDAIVADVLTHLTNETRKEHGVSELATDPLLMLAAQAKAEDMARRGYFSHVDPDGTTPWAWFDAVRYPYRYAGENLAVNFTDSRDVESAWVASPAHYANLIKPQYTRIGIGLAEGVYKGNKTTYVVQFFGTPPLGQRYSVYAHAQKALQIQKLAAHNPIRPHVALGQDTQETLAVDTSEAPEVLGVSTKASWLSRITQEMRSSPYMMNKVVLLGILILVIIAFILASIFRVQIRYREMLFDVLIIVAIITLLLLFNKRNKGVVEVPVDGVGSSIEIRE